VGVSQVRIHCWSCARSVEVDEHDTADGLARSGWALSHGETYCPDCARARGLAAAQGAAASAPAPASGGEGPPGPGSDDVQPFAVSPYASGESRFARSLRMLSASWRVLREHPTLMVFPVISTVASAIVGFVLFGLWTPPAANAQGVSSFHYDTLVVVGLAAAYPLTFISVYSSVALAEVLGGRLDGRQTTAGEGFSAANSRIGLIAAWSLLACTVGLVLRALEQRLPIAGRVASLLFGMAWSLATAFAVPILAYEGLGPFETVKRSAQIFRRRWGAQIGGSIGIGAAAAVLSIPLVLLLVFGTAASGGAGAAIALLAGAGLFALTAAVATMEQIYRVFVYRSAVGLDTSRGPFSQEDLRQPLTKRR
jgi:hypothetical protein